MNKQEEKKSELVAILPDDTDCSFTQLKKKLQQSRYFANSIIENDIDNEDVKFAYKIIIDNENFKQVYKIEYHARKYPTNYHYVPHDITKAEVKNAKNSKRYLLIKTDFQRDPLVDFFNQIKLLVTIVPDVILIKDLSAIQLLSGDWARDVFENDIPPSPQRMFSIHGVQQDDEVWLHTHGLERCGLKDVEILGVPKEGYERVGDLLNTIVQMIIDSEPPVEGEPITVANNIKIVFLKWKKAIKHLQNIKLGGKEDREENHSRDNLVIMLPDTKTMLGWKYKSPKELSKKLDSNPVFYITVSETKRMEELARRKFELFTQYFKKYKKNNDWKFSVKLGFLVDNNKDKNDKEHLWFKVVSINEENIEGKLLNEPYDIKSLHKGKNYTYTINTLTDWLIVSPFGNYTPDNIYDLLRKQKL
ncbi:DUF4026 domain-containing protein [Candidatus Dojkabacteria bacterium]|nr:DUF4026 domain-containing protein [Candidatus Dojkabacteria bacterium]